MINNSYLKKRKKTQKKMKIKLNGLLMKSFFLDKKNLNQTMKAKRSQVFLYCLRSFLVSLMKNPSGFIKKWIQLIMASSLLKISLLFLLAIKLQNFFVIKQTQIFFRKCSHNLKIYHSLHNSVKKCISNFMKYLIFHQ